MTITMSNDSNKDMCSITMSENASVYEVMEAISNLLLTSTYNYLSIMEAHRLEAERMEDAIRTTRQSSNEEQEYGL